MSVLDLMKCWRPESSGPLSSARVILDRQSLGEVQPAAATGTTDRVETSATPTAMETAPSRRVRFARPREWNIVFMDVRLPRW